MGPFANFTKTKPKNYQPENESFVKDQREATVADPASCTASTIASVWQKYAS